MHLSLSRPIPPIKEMTAFELPRFAVIIGRNGVGKTQLLKAISNGTVCVSGIPSEYIEEYNISSFQPQDSGRGGWGSSAFFHVTLDRFLSSDQGQPLVETAREIFDRILRSWNLNGDDESYLQFDRSVRSLLHQIPAFGILAKAKGESAAAAYVNAIHDEVLKKLEPGNRNSRGERTNQLGTFNNNQAALVCHAMRVSGKLPHELSRDDILAASHYEGGTIRNQLSQVFSRYKAEQYAWAHTESEKCDKSVQRLLDEYFQQNTPPWRTLRATLDRLRESSDDPDLFNFEFSDPEQDVLSYANHHQYSFDTKFTNRTTGDSYSVQELSSGEKILLCLCLSEFNRSIGQHRPKLVLLDELDSVLHPSMISALIAGVKEQFVKHGTGVIMATHSVTTVSLLEDDEIFRMTRSGGRIQVLPVTRAEAALELSEGLATIEDGLRIATNDSAAEVTILSEGNNVLHLQRWAKLFFGNRVKVFDKMRSRTGKNQLCSYSRLLANVEANTKFVVVFDCDAQREAEKLADELSESENVTVFAFATRDNSIAPRGIENNFSETHLQGFTVTSRSERTGKKTVSMSKEENAAFAEHVREHGTKEHFQHFGDLHSVVQEVLKRGSGRGSPRGAVE